jgi:DNA invertase Pin-like site-specific DNA recombinase
MGKIYAYVRVSTDMQDYHSQKHAISLRYPHIDKWIEDTGTGRKTHMGLANLIYNCERGDTVVVTAFDRLGRSVLHVAPMVEIFKKKGVSLISLRENVDLANPGGNLMFHVLTGVAEFESNMIASRVKAGIAAARARGAKFGAPRYDSIPEKAKALQQAITMRENGATLREINRFLKQNLNIEISIGTLSKYLKKG